MSATLRKLFLRASCLVVLGLGFHLGADQAMAQIRPAFTKNVDEPGRVPYEHSLDFNRLFCISTNCSNFLNFGSVILFDGPEVPAGKRLIIQHLTGRLPSSTTADVSVGLQVQRVINLEQMKWGFFGPFFNQFSLIGFSAPAFATYGPGERPRFNLTIPTQNGFSGYVSISGYLIDATN